VEQAQWGDRVLVPAGNWVASRTVVIDKPLTLQGEGYRSVIYAPIVGGVNAVAIHSSHVHLRNLTVRSPGGSGQPKSKHGVVVEALAGNLGDVVVEGVESAEHGGNGFLIQGGPVWVAVDVALLGCHAVHNGGCGVSGDRAYQALNLERLYSRLNSEAGVRLTRCGTVRLRSCMVESNWQVPAIEPEPLHRAEVVLSQCDGFTVDGCNIEGFTQAAYLASACTGGRFAGGQVYDTPAGAVGVRVEKCTGVHVGPMLCNGVPIAVEYDSNCYDCSVGGVQSYAGPARVAGLSLTRGVRRV